MEDTTQLLCLFHREGETDKSWSSASDGVRSRILPEDLSGARNQNIPENGFPKKALDVGSLSLGGRGMRVRFGLIHAADRHACRARHLEIPTGTT
jgi:hypothetical protein